MKAHADYSRYFTLKQRAYLINISEERDREHFESLSGIIIDRSGDTLALQIPYPTDELPENGGTPRVTYKLTSESMGGGIQMMADLIRVTAGNVFHLRLRGNMEMYQRRQAPRVDTAVSLFQIRRDVSLTVYRKEFRRITAYMDARGMPPGLKLQKTEINLSAGGLRLDYDSKESLSSLALFLLDLNDGQQPVCVVAEAVWNRLEGNVRKCGYRFVQILKADQERLRNHVQDVRKQRGMDVPPLRTNWELLDRMTFEEAPKSGTRTG